MTSAECSTTRGWRTARHWPGRITSCGGWPNPAPGSAAKPVRPANRSPGCEESQRPRAVIAAGNEARFIRAMLEPVCPVPFVAWPSHGLPGWVGALDLVVVLASDNASPGLVATVHEAVRRGCPAVDLLPAGLADRRARRGPVHRACCRPHRRRAGRRHRGAVGAAPDAARARGPTRTRGRRDGRGGGGLLAVRRRRGQPGEGPGHGAGRGPAAGLGRIGAGRPGQPPDRRGAPRRHRPDRAGGRRRRAAAGAGPGGPARPVRRPVRGRPGASTGDRAW